MRSLRHVHLPTVARALVLCALFAACGPRVAPETAPPEVVESANEPSDIDYAQTFVNLGNEYYAREQYGEAITHYRRAIAVNPYSDEAHAAIGMAFYRLGKTEQAGTSFRNALGLNPRNVLALNGAALVNEDERSRADQLRQALAIEPNATELRNNLCVSLAQGGSYDTAIGECAEAIRLDSTNAYAHYNLGYSQQKQGRLDEALTAYRAALRHRPEWGRVLNNIGLIHYNRSEFGAAIDNYERAIASEGNEPVYHYNLALAYEAVGRRLQDTTTRGRGRELFGVTSTDWRTYYRQAADELRVYLRIQPDARDSDGIRDKINELRRRAS